MRLSGWCSPDCGPRAHAACQVQQDKGAVVCECERHDGHNPAQPKVSECFGGVESETKRGPDRANESDPLATVSTTPKGA